MVWRTLREEFEPNYTIPTVKRGGGLVTIWAYFTQRKIDKLCILDLITDRFYYPHILEKNLLP